MRLRSRIKSGAAEASDSVSQPVSLLDFVINSRGSLREREVRPLAQQLARTLSLIHAHGVVHRNLKLENIFVCVDPTTATACEARHRRAIITDFTCAAVTTVPASGSVSPHIAPLTVRCGDQYSPAPELLLGPERGAQDSVPYSGMPVDVWGLGVVLYTLLCSRVPFDGPTLEVLREASLCSPVGLRFPRRVSRDCRDLLRRMLHADPATRASLDEVLNHPWMDPPAHRYPCMVSAGAGVPKYAALQFPDQDDSKWVYIFAALESKNGDDAWRSLPDTLKLVSRLCEPCSRSDSQARVLRGTCRLSRVRELPDRILSLLAKVRSCTVLGWSIPVQPSKERQSKMETA